MDGADLNTSVVSQMRLAVLGADQVRVLARAHADSELDVVITLARSRGLATWPERMALVGRQENPRNLSAASRSLRNGLQDCSSKRPG